MIKLVKEEPPIKFVRGESGEPYGEPKVITRRASEITPEIINWIWLYFLARGKLHILAGVPEAGKTTIALSYAAIVSRGGRWPDGTRAPVGDVLIWSSEDNAADTLTPRLMRMDADVTKIHFVEHIRPHGMKPRPFNPSTDLPALAAKAAEMGTSHSALSTLSSRRSIRPFDQIRLPRVA